MVDMSRRTLLAAPLLLAASISESRSSRATSPILGRGVNLFPWFSLTQEYPSPSTDYAWPPYQPQRPVPTSADLQALRRAGFDFVRLPVDPGPFLGTSSQSHRTTLLDTLIRAVAQIREAGLTAVVTILPNTATHFWTPAYLLSSPAGPGFEQYLDLVRKIASRLQSLASFVGGDRAASRIGIILEPVNEPPLSCGSPVWHAMQIEILRTVRQVAPDVTLVATGACGSAPNSLIALDPREFSAFQPLLFTFHFYEPFVFTHQGAPWMHEEIYRWLNTVPWPASSGSIDVTLAAVRKQMMADTSTPTGDRQRIFDETHAALKIYFDAAPAQPYIENLLRPVADWRERNRLAPSSVFIGEFGALRTDAKYKASLGPDRRRYVRDVRLTAETLGFPWAIWNLFDGMGIMDEETRLLDPGMVDALGLAPL